MNKYIIQLILVFLLLVGGGVFAQDENVWSKINDSKQGSTIAKNKTLVKKKQIFYLKMDALKSSLKQTVHKVVNTKEESFIVQFPDANGKLINFDVSETSVMHPDLAKKYPSIKSYKGVAVNDKLLRIRFSVDGLDVHAMLVDRFRNVQYIDPVKVGSRTYKVYFRKDLNNEGVGFKCFSENLKTDAKLKSITKFIDDKKLRTYQFALAGTGEYSQFIVNRAGLGGGSVSQKKAAVLAEMVTMVTRVNEIYENDLAVRLQLVANNDDLIFLNPNTDPYTNDDGAAMLGQNQTTCDNLIGNSNYDLGHVLSSDGGVSRALLGSVCKSSLKGQGVTGSSNPYGDYFYFDFVAHEVGHQFGANHTFNGDEGNCAGANRNDNTAVEPGSGSTIMGYANLCGSQNVQSHSDLYFHTVSIDEMWHVIKSSSCAAITNLNSNLNVPTANAGFDFVVPKSTPYILKGEGSDGDGDPISFCWEQIDNEITTVPPSETSKVGSLYRSLAPVLSGERYMPSLGTVVHGDVSSKWEVTSSVTRSMHFKLTVRDNNVEAGQLAFDEVKVTVNENAGPFIVTSQNVDNLVWTKNSTQNITWNVAGTRANGINASQVDILMSVDGGRTFPMILASAVSNDGNHAITVPNVSASTCYVMVRGNNHFFYAVNAKSFSVDKFDKTCDDYEAKDMPKSIPDNNLDGLITSIHVSDDVKIEDVRVHVKIDHTWISDLVLTLESPEGTVIELLGGACDDGVNMNVGFSDDGTDLICSFGRPSIAGVIKPVIPLYSFNGELSSGLWKLKVVDSAEDDFGTLESWDIEICSSAPVLNVANNVLNNFKVYPNPSNGIVHVEFTSKNNETVFIYMYDVLGNLVFNKSFVDSDVFFKEPIHVDFLSSGLYVLQVKKGEQISFQKLHIE